MANRDLLISEASYILPNLKNIVFFSVKTIFSRRIVSYYAAYSAEIFRITFSTYLNKIGLFRLLISPYKNNDLIALFCKHSYIYIQCVEIFTFFLVLGKPLEESMLLNL